MGSYSQWRTAADRGELRRVTWVCGEQRTLVEEVVDTVRRLVAPGPLDLATFTAGECAETEVWSAAYTYPVQGRRLILVREAQRLTRFDRLLDWLGAAKQLAGVHLLFVSAAHELPADGDGRKAKPTAYVEAMRPPKGHLVRCASLPVAEAVAWVQRRVAVDDDVALHLLRRTGGDLHAAGAVADKLALFDGQAGTRTIDALCAQEPEEFAEALIFLRKPQALHAIAWLPERELLRLTGLLDQRLDLLGVLWRANRAGLRSREIQGAPPFLVQRYLPAAKHYDPDRVSQARRLLAAIDDAIRAGARTGVLEALVALW